MNILIIGDIFGRPGRNAVKKILPEIKKKYKIEFTVANAENISHGKGFTEDTILEVQKAGVDFFTSGNHVWKQKTSIPKLDDKNFPMIRPLNYPPSVPGRGYQIIEGNLMKKILVINLMGRVFMPTHFDCPFRTINTLLEQLKHEHLNAILVDFHAEATAEKWALAHYLDSRVSIVYGTHTHVATNDSRILEGGTAFITDVGMVGAYDSVIGIEKKGGIRHFLTGLPEKHEIAQGKVMFNAVVLEVDEKTKLAKNIIQLKEEIRD